MVYYYYKITSKTFPQVLYLLMNGLSLYSLLWAIDGISDERKFRVAVLLKEKCQTNIKWMFCALLWRTFSPLLTLVSFLLVSLKDGSKKKGCGSDATGNQTSIYLIIGSNTINLLSRQNLFFFSLSRFKVKNQCFHFNKDKA